MKNKRKAIKKKRLPLPEYLEKRLAVYALAAGAAGVGLLALPPAAEATIISSSESITINSTHTPGTLTIKGAAELSFVEGAFVSQNLKAGIDVGPVGGAEVLAFGSFSASWLLGGSAIGPGGNFRTETRNGSKLMMGGLTSGGNLGGRWDGRSAFLGFEFKSNAKTYFGWAKMTFSSGGESAKLTEFAYDTVPGQSIDAGQTASPVPEPPTLALLALGAVGLLALRKKRLAAVKRESAANG